MNDLTPEQIRGAAKVVRACIPQSTDMAWAMELTEQILNRIADVMERERAVEAKREKRIEELAGVLVSINRDRIDSGSWITFAAKLADRYPALLEDDDE